MSREHRAFICAVVGGVVLLFTIGHSRPHLLVEDGVVESLSAAGFAAASLIALGTAFGKSACFTFTERNLLVLTSGLSLILFLSEISFGTRIFDLQMPQMSGGGEFGGGHDIVIVIFRLLRDAGRSGMLVAAGAAALLLASAGVLLCLFRYRVQVLLRHVLSSTFEFRLAAAVGMLAAAVTLDLIKSYKAAILEEVLEFTAGGILILAVFALFKRSQANRAPRRVERREVKTASEKSRGETLSGQGMAKQSWT